MTTAEIRITIPDLKELRDLKRKLNRAIVRLVPAKAESRRRNLHASTHHDIVHNMLSRGPELLRVVKEWIRCIKRVGHDKIVENFTLQGKLPIIWPPRGEDIISVRGGRRTICSFEELVQEVMHYVDGVEKYRVKVGVEEKNEGRINFMVERECTQGSCNIKDSRFASVPALVHGIHRFTDDEGNQLYLFKLYYNDATNATYSKLVEWLGEETCKQLFAFGRDFVQWYAKNVLEEKVVRMWTGQYAPGYTGIFFKVE